MPTNRTPIRHPRRGRLSHEQEMVLFYGKDPRWAAAFHDEEEQRDAWMRNRDRLLAWYRHGRRPMAWWRYETDLKYPGYDHERATLFEAGLLSETEAHELQTWWREEFERAYRPKFFFCDGPGLFFSGSVARSKHFAWADIPERLVRRWSHERRRKDNTKAGVFAGDRL